MTFVGLTLADQAGAESFVSEHGIACPVGYGADETIGKLAGTAPTIFVVDSEGRVAWHDSRARYTHDDIAGLPQLRAALAALIAGEPVPPPPVDRGKK